MKLLNCINRAFGTKTDALVVGLIFGWVILYFEIYRLASVRWIAAKVPLGVKLVLFAALLTVALVTLDGIYRGLEAQKPKSLSIVYFVVVFLLSMVFAVACANDLILFRLLSVCIFVCDRVLYRLKFKKRLQKEGISA